MSPLDEGAAGSGAPRRAAAGLLLACSLATLAFGVAVARRR
jgi:hypothetical protein